MLHALGFSEAALKQLAARPEASFTRYEVVSPLAGTVIEKHLTVGELVKDDTEAFVVADLARSGSPSGAPDGAPPGEERPAGTHLRRPSRSRGRGEISYVAPVSEETRTALMRVELPNPDGRWRPGLFVTATLAAGEPPPQSLSPSRRSRPSRASPASLYRRRKALRPARHTLGRQTTPTWRSPTGLAAGERYAATETFILKADLAKGEAAHQH